MGKRVLKPDPDEVAARRLIAIRNGRGRGRAGVLDRNAAETEVRRELGMAGIGGIGRGVEVQVLRLLRELRAEPRITLGAMKILQMSSLCYLVSLFMISADYVVASERVTLLPAYVMEAEEVMRDMERKDRYRHPRRAARRQAKMLAEDLGRWEDDGGPCR